MKKRPFETQRRYREAADKYDSEWLDSAVFGNEPTPGDKVQSAPPPIEAVTERTTRRFLGRKK